MEKKAKIVCLGFFIGIFLLGWSSMSLAADKVTLNLNWSYVGDHSPYFVALD